MDYWEYLAHSQQGAERENHRYYAREAVGNKNGRVVYRYFYTAQEYQAYKNSSGGNKKSIGAQKAEMDRRRAHRESVASQKKDMDNARTRAQHKASVAEQKKTLDRARHKESVASQKDELDKARKRKEHQQSVRRQKVRMDAKRTRAKRRAESKKGRDFVKRVMDNTRTRKGYSPQKV